MFEAYCNIIRYLVQYYPVVDQQDGGRLNIRVVWWRGWFQWTWRWISRPLPDQIVPFDRNQDRCSGEAAPWRDVWRDRRRSFALQQTALTLTSIFVEIKQWIKTAMAPRPAVTPPFVRQARQPAPAGAGEIAGDVGWKKTRFCDSRSSRAWLSSRDLVYCDSQSNLRQMMACGMWCGKGTRNRSEMSCWAVATPRLIKRKHWRTIWEHWWTSSSLWPVCIQALISIPGFWQGVTLLC